MDEEVKIHAIPESNMQLLQEKIDKLNRKAKKLNCEPITINIVGTIDKKELIYIEGKKQNALIRYNKVTITGKAPIISNWELIATCEQKEHGMLISCIPGKTYPERYRSLNICEHCHSDRYRKYTYLVRNTITEEYKMIGKQCLKDFLGHINPESYAYYLQWLIDPDIEEESKFAGGRGYIRYDTKTYLEYVSACINADKWTSRGIAREYNTRATCDYAYDAMIDFQIGREKIVYPQPNKQDEELTEKAIVWAKSITELDNNYFYSLNLLSQEETVSYKDIGILASIFVAYKRYLDNITYEEKKREEEGKKSLSKYVGNIGDKVNIELRYINSFSWESEYGIQWLHKFIDSDGNTYTWKTNKILDHCHNEEYKEVEKGETLKIKGTIKEHKEFNNEKQTVLTRCKIQA
jgi:hypothetical protein